jgi:CBS domain-containing protein
MREDAMEVRDVMVFDAVTIGGEEPVSAAARLMEEQGIGMLVVCEEKAPAGIITDRDVTIRCVAAGHVPGNCVVSSHMSRPVLTADTADDVFQAVRVMRSQHIKRLPVTEHGTLVGVVSVTDITQAVDQPLHDLLFGGGRVRAAPTAAYAGHVNHYFTKLGVAGLDLHTPLHRGDRVHFVGHTTDLAQAAESIEVDHRKVDAAYEGDAVAMKVDARVRVGDSVYIETG